MAGGSSAIEVRVHGRVLVWALTVRPRSTFIFPRRGRARRCSHLAVAEGTLTDVLR